MSTLEDQEALVIVTSDHIPTMHPAKILDRVLLLLLFGYVRWAFDGEQRKRSRRRLREGVRIFCEVVMMEDGMRLRCYSWHVIDARSSGAPPP